MRALVGSNGGGIDRQRAAARDCAGPDRAVGARKHLGRQHLAACLLVFEEQRLRRHRIAGLEDQAVAL